jgi:hypothetical protein
LVGKFSGVPVCGLENQAEKADHDQQTDQEDNANGAAKKFQHEEGLCLRDSLCPTELGGLLFRSMLFGAGDDCAAGLQILGARGAPYSGGQ